MNSEHHVVCGLNGLGLRLAETLHHAGVEVVVVAGKSAKSHYAAIKALGISVIDGFHDDEEALLEAGVNNAASVAFVADDDIGNLRGALIAGKQNPGMNIVLRLFNEDLGERLHSLFDNCTILSQSAVAAPFFAAAALGEIDGDRVAVAGRALLVQRVEKDWDSEDSMGEMLLPLTEIRDGTTRLFPSLPSHGGSVLVDLGPFDDVQVQENTKRRRKNLRTRVKAAFILIRQLVDRRLRLVLLAMVTALGCATTFFTITKGLNPLDALYFSVVTLSTVGYGDINLMNDPPHVKVVGIIFIIVGAAITAVLFAVLTDILIGARLARVLGGIRGRMGDHVIVCGMGNVGIRVAQHLAERDIPVVAVERDEDSRHLGTLRSMGVPVVFGDATLPETLTAAQIERARSLVAATDDDVADLLTAVTARSLHPDLRIILRLFDHDLSTAIERRFNIHISRSSAAISAPVFAAAMLANQAIATVNASGQTIVFAEATLAKIQPTTLEALYNTADLRVIAVVDHHGATKWMPAKQTAVEEGDRVVVVGRPADVSSFTKSSATTLV